METEEITNSQDHETTEQTAGASCYMSATYDPSDDKIRLEAMSRLTPEEYERAKAAGFRWAPMQKCFYTVWNPRAEDLAIEWCGSIEDSNKTLVDRAEERADRFETYSEHRAQDADRAQEAVHRIADGIPLGQPILIGHHSERHARRDAEKIENGMRKAVNMWKTSEYWKRRAAGALHHAQYKELPGVRARRIKTLEAELRKNLRNKKNNDDMLRVWTGNLTIEQARFIAGNTPFGNVTMAVDGGRYWNAYDVLRPDGERYKDCPSKTVAEIQERVRQSHAKCNYNCDRWIEHLSNRLEYEHALLEEAGATNLLAKKPKSAAAQLPLCNYEAPDGLRIENKWNRGEFMNLPQKRMTQAEYAAINQDYKGTRVVDNSHRVRSAMIAHGLFCVFLTDSKVHKRPDPLPAPDRTPKPRPAPIPQEPKPEDLKREQFQAMESSLKAGVQVVSANQLFPTPPDLAARMVEMADIQPEHRVLEPSAGTGNLCRELYRIHRSFPLVAIEINPSLCEGLRDLLEHQPAAIRCADFLECVDEEGFDRIVMNPPFENGADIKHIMHALKFLKPGGRLVAICANGPRQQEKLGSIADSWERLPAGTFAGTNVNAALIEISNGTDQTKC